MKEEKYKVGERYAVRYEAVVPGIGRETTTINKSFDISQIHSICGLPHDEEIDSLYTIVEYLGNGLWKDTITGFVFGTKMTVHPEFGVNSDNPKSMLILEGKWVTEDAPMYPSVYKASPFEKITPYIAFCTIKTRGKAKEIVKKLADYERIVSEADKNYREDPIAGIGDSVREGRYRAFKKMQEVRDAESQRKQKTEEQFRTFELRESEIVNSTELTAEEKADALSKLYEEFDGFAATTLPEVDLDKPIFIRKESGKKKDAVRISKEEDIPEFLRGSVTIENGELVLDCVEGKERAPLGSVIGYEKSDKTASGMNTWNIANAATNLVEKDGEFFTKATVFQAERVGSMLPSFMKGAPAALNHDGSWTVTTDWGQSTGFPGEAYFVRYGTKDDGTPDVNILTKTEESYQAYYVCDENGNIIGRLSEIDPVMTPSIEDLKALRRELSSEENTQSANSITR